MPEGSGWLGGGLGTGLSPRFGPLADITFGTIETLWRASGEPSIDIDRRDNTSLPVGDSNVLSIPSQPGDELSHLVIAERPPTLPSPVAGMNVARDWFEYWEAQGSENELLPPVGATSAQEPISATILPPDEGQGDDMSFWDDLGDLALGAIQSEFLTPNNQGPITLVEGSTIQPSVVSTQTGGGGSPPINPGTGVPYKNMMWNPRLGKWVRCRRRRRKLLTDSDFNALLKLQTLKVNQNMSIAIAKALGR